MANVVPSLTDEAYRHIRTAIIEGRIRPNVRLVAADLAKQLDISRTPIREALQMLANDGLVAATGRGFIVHEHSADEIRHIYEVRAALEGMAARLAADRGSRDQVQPVCDLGRRGQLTAASPRDLVIRTNDAFHAALLAAAGNDLLAMINRRTSRHFFNHNVARLYTPDEITAALEGHARIVDALEAGDPEAAARAAREHVVEALEVTLLKLR